MGRLLAAMMPLNDGYRGSTTPAVTVTRAGNGHLDLVVAGLGLAVDQDLLALDARPAWRR